MKRAGGLPRSPVTILLPQCVWADGSELSDAELTELREVHSACTQRVQLLQGDLVVIDVSCTCSRRHG